MNSGVIEELKKRMTDDVVCFTFTKSDGTTRVAYGTLNPKFIKDQGAMPDKSNPRRHGEEILPYYDVEKEGWRCFVKSRFIGIDNNYCV